MDITKQQWQNVCINLIGLRSEDNATTIRSAASYAMDCGKNWNDPIPKDWMKLLKGTIGHMQEYTGYRNRYLLIVKSSTGGPWEYQDCFPKCSAKATVVLAATSLDDDVDDLCDWVLNNI